MNWVKRRIKLQKQIKTKIFRAGNWVFLIAFIKWLLHSRKIFIVIHN